MAAKKTAPKRPAAAKKVVSKKAPKRSAARTATKATKPARKQAKAKAPAKAKATARAAAKPAPKKRPHGAVVHWEIQAADPTRQRDFFSSLFDWPIDANNPQNYGMVPHGGADSIPGGIGPSHDATGRVTFYVEVPDINTALAKAESLGAATVMPRMDLGMVVMAQFRDLEGNLIGLVESDVTS